MSADRETLLLADQLVTCVRRCQAWQSCGLWLGRMEGGQPARHCEWWPEGIPLEATTLRQPDGDPNTLYVERLEREQQRALYRQAALTTADRRLALTAAYPPRSALTPDVDRWCRELQAGAEVIRGAAILGATFALIFALLWMAGRAV